MLVPEARAAADVEPIPVFDYDSTEKAVVVGLHFLDALVVELESVEVVPGPARGRLGDPPLLGVELLDLNDGTLEEFNAWHPLWVFEYGGPGESRRTVLSEGTGYIVFPFRPDVATMEVTDVGAAQELISVDLIPGLHNFCRSNPDDPDCANIVNRPPACDANGPYSEECAGDVTSVTLDGTASADPDGDALSYDWSGPFVGGAASGATPTVQFPGVGRFPVDLTVSDEFGGIAMCAPEVSVVDTTPPSIQCNAPATIVPRDAPIVFQATATDICVGSVDIEMPGFDCFSYTKKGKRIDKTESCQVAVEGDTITIFDSGGVDDHITWIVIATDSSGNQASLECEVLVAHPVK